MRLDHFHNEIDPVRAPGLDEVPALRLQQPDENDRARAVRWLRSRVRYRYVRPKVRVVDFGLRIESPCCSRNIDPTGGIVQIAHMQHVRSGEWCLYWMDRAASVWRLHGVYERYSELAHELNEDPGRRFWQ